MPEMSASDGIKAHNFPGGCSRLFVYLEGMGYFPAEDTGTIWRLMFVLRLWKRKTTCIPAWIHKGIKMHTLFY